MVSSLRFFGFPQRVLTNNFYFPLEFGGRNPRSVPQVSWRRKTCFLSLGILGSHQQAASSHLENSNGKSARPDDVFFAFESG